MTWLTTAAVPRTSRELFFCVKCHTYMDEQPAVLAESKNDTAKEVEQASNMQAEVIGRLLNSCRVVSKVVRLACSSVCCFV